MTVFLLDVNVVIALIDPDHVHDDVAHAWFRKIGRRAWATCPIVENGVVRIVSHPAYPGLPGSAGVVSAILSDFCATEGHVFWPDDISLLDQKKFVRSRLLSHAQVTDVYLLALAHTRRGQLATFHRRIVVDAVHGGADRLHVIE